MYFRIKSAESADQKNRSSPKHENHFDYIFDNFSFILPSYSLKSTIIVDAPYFSVL